MRSLLFIMVGMLLMNSPATTIDATKVTKAIKITSMTKTKDKINLDSVDYTKFFSEDDIIILACTIHNEAEIVKSLMEKSGVGWCAINRLETWEKYKGASLSVVLRDPGQFVSHYTKYTQEEYDLALDICKRAALEMSSKEPINVGRTLPLEYCYFTGDGRHNNFRVNEHDRSNDWGWSWGSPYPS